MKQNPYQPPESRQSYPSFRRRLNHALGMAIREFRRGMAQERMDRRDVISSCLSAAALLLILLLVTLWIIGLAIIGLGG